MLSRRVSMAKDDEEAVAEFIRSKGVTRCPTACSGPTQATVAHSDRTELQRYEEAQEAARLERPIRFRKGRVSKKSLTAREPGLTNDATGHQEPPLPDHP
jgi:hypothetical protein